jgi:hypothetical protein
MASAESHRREHRQRGVWGVREWVGYQPQASLGALGIGWCCSEGWANSKVPYRNGNFANAGSSLLLCQATPVDHLDYHIVRCV